MKLFNTLMSKIFGHASAPVAVAAPAPGASHLQPQECLLWSVRQTVRVHPGGAR